MQLISFQEKAKIVLRNQTLHEWMCFESESVIKHNWTDVAIHDRKILNKMRSGDTRLWFIHELGSQFFPLYCKLYEKQKQEESEYDLSVLEIFMLRFFKKDRLSDAQNSLIRKTCKFYFITKGDSDYNGFISPATYGDIVDLVFSGKMNKFIDA